MLQTLEQSQPMQKNIQIYSKMTWMRSWDQILLVLLWIYDPTIYFFRFIFIPYIVQRNLLHI